MIGKAAFVTGAGRETKNDTIDLGAGIMLKKRVGDKVTKGEILARIFADNDNKCKEANNIIKQAIKITPYQPEEKPLIYEIIK